MDQSIAAACMGLLSGTALTRCPERHHVHASAFGLRHAPGHRTAASAERCGLDWLAGGGGGGVVALRI